MIKLNYIEVIQKGITFYLTAANASEIVDRVNVNRRNLTNIEEVQIDLLNLEETVKDLNELKIGKGLQRELLKSKVDEIAKYVSEEMGLIPNSIILNISDPLNLVTFGDSLDIPDDISILLTALDGQHRLEGIKKYLLSHPDETYQIPLTIFYNAELEFQAYLFSIINSKQTKINKSFLYDLLSLTKKEIDEFKLSHEIAYWLNSSDKSILKSQFKLLGKGSGWLSQAAFIDYLMPNIFISKRDSSNVVFKHYMKNKEYNKIAIFINEYFKTLIEIYPEFHSDNFIFRTSYIFGLFMKLMPYIYIYSLDLNSFVYDLSKVSEAIGWIKEANIDFHKGGVNSGVGSSGRQSRLLGDLITILQSKTNIKSKITNFQHLNR